MKSMVYTGLGLLFIGLLLIILIAFLFGVSSPQFGIVAIILGLLVVATVIESKGCD